MTAQELAADLLLAVKRQNKTDEQVLGLAELEPKQLEQALTTDTAKKAFWINLYNAFFQILRQELNLEKPTVYRKKVIQVAGFLLSLDDIEHTILRKYRWKWTLGYLPKPFMQPTLRRWAVQRVDFRIHFALNCGAISCPPIAFYDPQRLEQQLELATSSFLENETTVKPEQNEIHITRLFQWYQGDFGGKRGIRRILAQYLDIPTRGWKLVYQPYDWTEALHNFK